jgi:hypothetical protein
MAYGDIMDRLNETRPVKDSKYNPFIPDGNHDLVIISIEPYNNQDENFCVRATFLIESSDNPQVAQGMQLDAVWNLDKPAPFPGGDRDKDRFAAFLNKLQGVETTPTSHQPLARACLKVRAEGGQLEMQPCRGARIQANGYTKPPKQGKKPFCSVTYTHVPQAPEAVAAMRQVLDQRLPYTYRPQQPRAAQPQGYVAYPGAPHAAAQPQYTPPAQPTAPAAPVASGWVFPPKG